MKLFKIQLTSKNNVKNGFYLYTPIAEIDGRYYFCESIKSKTVLKISDIDVDTVKVKREIPTEYYIANGIR